MSSYQYRKSHCGDEMVVRLSYLHSGISYTDKATPLYWIGAQAHQSCRVNKWVSEMWAVLAAHLEPAGLYWLHDGREEAGPHQAWYGHTNLPGKMRALHIKGWSLMLTCTHTPWHHVNSPPTSAAYMRQRIGPALVQIMACCLFSTKPLSKTMLGYCQLDPWEQISVKF